MKNLTKKQQNDLVSQTSNFGLIGRVIGRMEISQLKYLLRSKEDIESLIYGIHEGSFVMMVATNERLLFIDRGWLNSRADDYQYDHIESIEYDISLISGMVRVLASQGTIFLKFVPNKLIHGFVKTIESHMGSRVPESKIELSEIEQIEHLSKLHRFGDLTDEEFKVEKSKIINSK